MYESLASDSVTPVTTMECPVNSDIEMDDKNKVKGVGNIIVMDRFSNTLWQLHNCGPVNMVVPRCLSRHPTRFHHAIVFKFRRFIQLLPTV
jgi:hypothetical protein